MEHLQIFSYIGVLITGGAAVTYITFTHISHRFPFLKPFILFILFINLRTLIYMFLYYYQVNLRSGTAVFEKSALFNLAGTHIVFLLFIVTFSMIQTVRKLDDLPVPVFLKTILLVVAGFSILLYLGQLLLTVLGASHYWLIELKIRGICSWVFYGLNILFLIWLMIRSFKVKPRSKRRINRSFSVFYLLSFIGILSTNLMSTDWQIIVILTFKILMNLFPLFWIRKFLLKYGCSIPLTLEETFLKTMAGEYGISTREREILELIFKGRSNKQIASQLCIAHHTVKNHLYRLYQKLGVNSRYELVTFFLNKKQL